MGNFTIWPIPLGQWTMDKSMVTYRLGFGQPTTFFGYVWYIEGPKDKILVDAGVSCEYLSQRRGIPATEIQSLDSGLQKVGLTPHDIDLVIITHLHSDHVADAHKFPRAKFLIQKNELDFARRPHPTVAGQYPSELFADLNFEALNGDTEICEGLSVLSTPGHTLGGQSISVSTLKGTAVISGICSCRENFKPPKSSGKGMLVYPFGIFVNLFEMYDSLLRIKEIADIIIPIHDPEYGNSRSIP